MKYNNSARNTIYRQILVETVTPPITRKVNFSKIDSVKFYSKIRMSPILLRNMFICSRLFTIKLFYMKLLYKSKEFHPKIGKD